MSLSVTPSVKSICRMPLYFWGAYRYLQNWPEFISSLVLLGRGKRTSIDAFVFRNGIRLQFPPDYFLAALYELREIYFSGLYTRQFGVRIGQSDIIIDAGASFGSFTFYEASSAPNGLTYTFEPDPVLAGALLNNLTENTNINNIVFHQAFLIGQDNAKAQSRYDFDSPAISLESLFLDQGLRRCDLLKIDVEGGEYPILLETPAPVLARIGVIVGEWHEFEDGQSCDTLLTRLREIGFETEATCIGATTGYFIAKNRASRDCNSEDHDASSGKS